MGGTCDEARALGTGTPGPGSVFPGANVMLRATSCTTLIYLEGPDGFPEGAAAMPRRAACAALALFFLAAPFLLTGLARLATGLPVAPGPLRYLLLYAGVPAGSALLSALLCRGDPDALDACALAAVAGAAWLLGALVHLAASLALGWVRGLGDAAWRAMCLYSGLGESLLAVLLALDSAEEALVAVAARRAGDPR